MNLKTVNGDLIVLLLHIKFIKNQRKYNGKPELVEFCSGVCSFHLASDLPSHQSINQPSCIEEIKDWMASNFLHLNKEEI